MKTGKGIVKNRWQIALYLPLSLANKIKREARKRNRGYGPTVVEILRQYFEEQKMQNRIANELKTEVPAAQ